MELPTVQKSGSMVVSSGSINCPSFQSRSNLMLWLPNSSHLGQITWLCALDPIYRLDLCHSSGPRCWRSWTPLAYANLKYMYAANESPVFEGGNWYFSTCNAVVNSKIIKSPKSWARETNQGIESILLIQLVIQAKKKMILPFKKYSYWIISHQWIEIIFAIRQFRWTWLSWDNHTPGVQPCL